MKDGGAAALEALVNQIAHDVRNHAFTIGLQAEMGTRRSADSPEIKANFEAILRQVDALNRYIEQMLLFGRPITLTPISVDVVTLVREQVQRLQYQWNAGETPPEIRVEAAELAQRGRWDPRAVGYAVTAILDNAVRSATPPPPVVVSVGGDSHCAVVEVRDAGRGIPPDVLAKIAVPMAVRRPGAAGLGLAIARKMLDAHGGRLELESGPNGTTARLTLPWEAAGTSGP